MWELDFVEKLKNLLLEREWQTVSVYRTKDKVLVYVDGSLEVEMPITPEEGEE